MFALMNCFSKLDIIKESPLKYILTNICLKITNLVKSLLLTVSVTVSITPLSKFYKGQAIPIVTVSLCVVRDSFQLMHFFH